MKRVITLLFALSLLFLGCKSQNKGVSKDFYHAVEIARVSVPNGGGVNYSFDSVELVETDMYGRELFFCKKWTEQVCILLICQNKDDTYAYYYEDYSYQIHPKDYPDFKDDEVQWLKDKNDWNRPLNQQHMVSVNYRESERDINNYNQYSNVIRSALHLESEEVTITLDGLERDQKGNKYILVKALSTEASDKSYRNYLVLYSDTEEGNVITYCEIVPDLNCRESIIAFKDECALLTQ